jgi:hypothetical protein
VRCIQLTKKDYDQRGVVRRAKESISRLASEVL